MKKFLVGVAIIGLIMWTTAGARAGTFEFVPNDGAGYTNDVKDLDHNYYYGWSITGAQAGQLAAELKKGYEITSATLTYKNIWDWTKEVDKLHTFLLSSPPPLPNGETVPVVINGVTQGTTSYTYTKSTVYTQKTRSTTPPTGYDYTGETVKISGVTYYIHTKTVISTKKNTTGVAPSGYTKTSETFVPKMVTLKAGVPIGPGGLWERYDGQSNIDIDWGSNVESYRIRDVDGNPANPWEDPIGGSARNFNLIYEFDEASVNKLFDYALGGSFGIGIDPDCHYYNEGVTLTITTAQVPEPGISLLFGLGLIGMAGARRKTEA